MIHWISKVTKQVNLNDWVMLIKSCVNLVWDQITSFAEAYSLAVFTSEAPKLNLGTSLQSTLMF